MQRRKRSCNEVNWQAIASVINSCSRKYMQDSVSFACARIWGHIQCVLPVNTILLTIFNTQYSSTQHDADTSTNVSQVYGTQRWKCANKKYIDASQAFQVKTSQLNHCSIASLAAQSTRYEFLGGPLKQLRSQLYTDIAGNSRQTFNWIDAHQCWWGEFEHKPHKPCTASSAVNQKAPDRDCINRTAADNTAFDQFYLSWAVQKSTAGSHMDDSSHSREVASITKEL